MRFVGLFSFLFLLASAAAEEKPNIVLFLVDDMGWQDTSVPFADEVTPFNKRYRTPNMERLAEDGVKFTNAYACSICSPTRISLMTGMNAARHRVTNWTLRKNASNDRKHPVLDFPEWNVNGLSPDRGIERTFHARALPDYLKEAGYETIHVGKAHFGAVGTPGEDPLNIGFTINIAGHAAGGPGSFLGTQNFSAIWRDGDEIWDVPGLEKYHGKDIFLTEVLTREGLASVGKAVREEKPFFLYMSHYAVHVPFAEDSRFIERYKSMGLDEKEAMYAAMVEGMDKSLGDILDYLNENRLSENTIVMFMSDNGGLSAHGRGGEPHTHNRPLSSGKGSAHEGGVRVPMIVKWPGFAEAGGVNENPVIIEDFFPSILEMAGLGDSVVEVDGKSLVPFLRGSPASSSGRPLFWHVPNNWGGRGPGIGPSSTILKNGWKLIYYHNPERVPRYELFNLEEDLGETENLADSNPEKRDALAKELAAYLKSVDAQMPTIKASGELVELPR